MVGRRTSTANQLAKEDPADAYTIPDVAAADAENARMGRAPCRRIARARDHRRRRPGARRAGDRDRRGRLWYDPARAAAPGPEATLAAGASGGAARRLLLSGADRAPGGDHQFPRDLQRPYRHPYDGLRARLCPRPAALHSAAATARMEKTGAERGRAPSARDDSADCRRRRDRQRDRAALRRLWHAGDRCRRAPPRRAAGRRRIAPRATNWTRCCRPPIS